MKHEIVCEIDTASIINDSLWQNVENALLSSMGVGKIFSREGQK